jgi:acyl-coenzyme A thioesterase PaaI-like protein
MSGVIVPAPFALCDGCSAQGVCRYGIDTEQLESDGSASFSLLCPQWHEGSRGTAHGGWIASALEEILGRLVHLHGVKSVAKSLAVDFIKPVPLAKPLRARAWVISREARRWEIGGDLMLDTSGALLAKATGVSVVIDKGEHQARFQQWLNRQ